MKVSIDPDQTLLQEHSDLGLHCLLRHALLKTKGLSVYYGIRFIKHFIHKVRFFSFYSKILNVRTPETCAVTALNFQQVAITIE